MQTGTSNENTMADWARTNNVEYKPVVIEQFNEVVTAFAAGRCDVFTTDASGLASIRISKLTKDRQSVGLGKSVEVRVDIGGSSIIKTKKNISINYKNNLN